jgi:hypothetical protein
MSAITEGAGTKAQSSATPGLRRDVGRIALMFTSVGSVIGSGWLLGALNATQIAGPAASLKSPGPRRRSRSALRPSCGEWDSNPHVPEDNAF